MHLSAGRLEVVRPRPFGALRAVKGTQRRAADAKAQQLVCPNTSAGRCAIGDEHEKVHMPFATEGRCKY